MSDRTALVILAVIFPAFLIMVAWEAAHPAPAHPDVTICHSRTQTNCLWVEGTSEWH